LDGYNHCAFIDREPQSAGVGNAICQDVIAGAGQPLRFIDPRSQSAGVARGVCLFIAELLRVDGILS